jgi:hypothetical protein
MIHPQRIALQLSPLYLEQLEAAHLDGERQGAFPKIFCLFATYLYVTDRTTKISLRCRL